MTLFKFLKTLKEFEMKRHLRLWMACSILVLIGLLGCTKTEQMVDNKIATVNGEAITEKELFLFIDQYRASFVQEACQKTGLEYNDNFWEAEYNGTTMSMGLKNKALKHAVKIKVQQIKMVDENIMESSSYQYFLDELTTENSRREQALNQGSVVYGIQQYTEKSYFDYLFENRLIRLKEIMGKNELAASDQILEQFYEEIKVNYPFFQNENGGYREFADVKGAVQARYIDMRYEEWVENQVKHAKVDIHENLFDRLPVI